MLKKTTLIVIFLAGFAGFTNQVHGQIAGFWNGYVNLMGQDLRIVFFFEETQGGFTGVMGSPDQGLDGMPVTQVHFVDNALEVSIDELGLTFSGVYDGTAEQIAGQLKQQGMAFPTVLQRQVLEAREIERPQTPKPPFPYTEETVTIAVANGKYQLEGSFTRPETPMIAAVLLVSGSGPQDRDSEILGHRPFAVWADYLSRRGIAVLRYDERGVAQSTGNFNQCNTLDLSADAASAFASMHERVGKDVPCGVIGHSEGGIVAPVVATLRSDVDFIVSLAGAGLPGKDVLYTQNIDIAVAEGLTKETAEARANRTLGAIERVIAGADSLAISEALRDYFTNNPSDLQELSSAEEFELWNTSLNTIWMRSFLALDPREYWSKVTCPVLAINGDRDTQVNAAQNLRAIQFATRRAKNGKVKTITLADHNHLFQRSTTGAISEYGSLSETVSEETLETVYSWIRNTFATK
jgi:hypothetical protein